MKILILCIIGAVSGYCVAKIHTIFDDIFKPESK